MILPVQITFGNIPADPALEAQIRAQAARLERYYSPITSCRVMVEMLGRHVRGNLYHVRIDVGVPGAELLVESEPNLHAGLQDVGESEIRKSTELGKLHKTPKRAVRDAFHDMRRRLQDYGRKQRGDTKRRQEALIAGKVVSLRPELGCGFVEAQDGHQVYFHREAVLGNHFDMLRDGSAVRFCEEAGDKGPQASTVKVVHPRKQAQSASVVVPIRGRATRAGVPAP